MMEYLYTYVNVAIMGASATQFSRFSTVQNAATALCHGSFIPLQHRCHTVAVGLLLIVAAVNYLKTYCPNFFTLNLTLHRSSRLATSTKPYLLADTVVCNLLDIF